MRTPTDIALLVMPEPLNGKHNGAFIDASLPLLELCIMGWHVDMDMYI